jgi:hypothetical protein
MQITPAFRPVRINSSTEVSEDGRLRLVRHGHLPEIMTGIGPVAMRCPRVRDRVGEARERIRFSSAEHLLFLVLDVLSYFFANVRY